MRINAWVYKKFRCPRNGLRVHLGPGQAHYLDGWLNVDANIVSAKPDLWADFSKGLPFKDGSVDVVYSHHVIEHLRDDLLQPHFKEMFRVLRPGGGIRIGGPHMGNACRKYLEGDIDWFPEFPDKRESIGGRFSNFLFCASEHLTGIDETYLSELAVNAGFDNISICVPNNSTTLSSLGVGQQLFALEGEDDFDLPHTVILEAVRH